MPHKLIRAVRTHQLQEGRLMQVLHSSIDALFQPCVHEGPPRWEVICGELHARCNRVTGHTLPAPNNARMSAQLRLPFPQREPMPLLVPYEGDNFRGIFHCRRTGLVKCTYNLDSFYRSHDSGSALCTPATSAQLLKTPMKDDRGIKSMKSELNKTRPWCSF
jgi:hypothetical protein